MKVLGDENLIKNIIGMTKESADAYCKSLGYYTRIYSSISGADLVFNRISLKLENNRVKNYIIG